MKAQGIIWDYWDVTEKCLGKGEGVRGMMPVLHQATSSGKVAAWEVMSWNGYSNCSNSSNILAKAQLALNIHPKLSLILSQIIQLFCRTEIISSHHTRVENSNWPYDICLLCRFHSGQNKVVSRIIPGKCYRHSSIEVLGPMADLRTWRQACPQRAGQKHCSWYA